MQQTSLVSSAYLEKIYGPPGCGKTTSLISRLRAEIASGVPAERIAYLTFSRAAIEEAKERLGIENAPWFRTIHSACCAMLGISKGHTFTADDYAALHKETGYNLSGYDLDNVDDLDHSSDSRRDNAVKFALDLAASRCVPVAEVLEELHYDRVDPESVARFAAAYRSFKGRAGKRDFMDMLIDYEMDPAAPPMPVDVVILDEAQDLSRLQWRVFRKLAAGAQRIYVAGDDDQSIYGFIGADEYGFLDLESTEETILDHSYRCPALVGEVATGIIRGVSRRRDKHVTWQDRQGSVRLLGLAPEQLPWEDFYNRKETVMYLARHRRQLYDVSKDLNRRAISHSIKGEAPNLGPFAEAVGSYLRCAVKGQDIPRDEALRMLDEFRRGKARNALIRERSRRTIDKAWLDEAIPPAGHWTDTLAFGSAKLRAKLRRLQRLLNEHGLGVIGAKPAIDLSTIHASKGRQAGLVIVLSDCYKATQESMRRNGDSETRLAYVAVTRAQRAVVILRPRTDCFLTPLAEVRL